MLWLGRNASLISCILLWVVVCFCGGATKEKGRVLPISPKSFRQSLTGYLGCIKMDKKELVDCICEINTSAKIEFLTKFSEADLAAYLEHLRELDLEEMVVCS